MARPRIFLSSTFYDLRQIRADLETFIRRLGYESVRNERGQIPYGNDKRLETYCYREIEACDIVIAIIGGRYGSSSYTTAYSISQMELKTAVKLAKNTYVFIERSVYSEYRTYLQNKATAGIQFSFVDDSRIYEFIEEINALPNNNPIASFETAEDITSYLLEQWAGLFQRLLQDQSRIQEENVVQRLESTATTLDRMLAYLLEKQSSTDVALQEIVLTNHPAFERLRELLIVRYRVFFTTRSELDTWLNSRQFRPVPESSWDDAASAEWMKDAPGSNSYKLLKVSQSLFNAEGKLKPMYVEDWSDESITLGDYPYSPNSSNEDDIPF